MKFTILIALIFFAASLLGQKSLHLYGGQSHDVYLGCINCNDIDRNSVWNDIGVYGSNISAKSIWNDIGVYGSDLSIYSPFNSMASFPPVIVDKDGNFYGYLTTNEFRSKRSELKLASIICKYYQDIQKDVSGWYKKLFN